MEDTPNKRSADIRLSRKSGSDEIEVRIQISSDWVEAPKEFRIELASHDFISSSWCATIVERMKDGEQLWSGQFTVAGDKPRLLEVTALDFGLGEKIINVTPNQQFHFEPMESGEWATGVDASNELNKRIGERTTFFSQPLIAPGATMSSQSFIAVMVADNVHLTENHYVPGFMILPIRDSTLGADIAVVLNNVISEMGHQCAIDMQGWLTKLRGTNPAAIVYAPNVRAQSPEEAHQHVADLTHQLLDITALRREARPRLLGGVLLDSSGAATRVSGTWVESPGYMGNLLGGFLSGEEPHELVEIWKVTRQDTRIQLWLSMYADALSESRQDYSFFRAFNLLETIATQVIPRKQAILDDAGQSIMMDAKNPYTTNEARGNVFELVRRLGQKGQIAESSFATGFPVSIPGQPNAWSYAPGNVWEEIDIWVKIRNTVAHSGTWRLPPGERPDSKRIDLEARIAIYAVNGGGSQGGFEAIRRTVRNACKITLYQAIAGRL